METNSTQRPIRAQETREKAEKRQVTWRPAHDLPVPDPQDGYVFRWKRVAMMGQADPANMARARREGWEPCKASDHPELLADFAAFGVKATDTIEIGGLVLCKTAKENAEARKDYYANMSRSWVESVDNNFMRESDPRMPLFTEKSSKVTFGKG